MLREPKILKCFILRALFRNEVEPDTYGINPKEQEEMGKIPNTVHFPSRLFYRDHVQIFGKSTIYRCLSVVSN